MLEQWIAEIEAEPGTDSGIDIHDLLLTTEVVPHGVARPARGRRPPSWSVTRQGGAAWTWTRQRRAGT